MAYAGNFMTAIMLVNMSEDVSWRAMAAGNVAAIHDELAEKNFGEVVCRNQVNQIFFSNSRISSAIPRAS